MSDQVFNDTIPVFIFTAVCIWIAAICAIRFLRKKYKDDPMMHNLQHTNWDEYQKGNRHHSGMD